MKTNVLKNSLLTLVLLVLLFTIALVPVSVSGVAMAETKVSEPVTIPGMERDGKYRVPTPNDITVPMAKVFYSEVGYVEKIGDNYYFSYTVLAGNKMKNWAMKLVDANGLDGQNVGSTLTVTRTIDPSTGKPAIFNDGSALYSHTYTYSATAEDLKNPYYFSMNVMPPPMSGKFSDIIVTIDLSKAEYIGPVDNPEVERLAARVPIIKTAAADTEWEKGTDYSVAPASATFFGDSVDVTTSAYYVREDEGGNKTKEDVEIVNGKLKLSEFGEYHVVYKAQTDSQEYKTNLGNSSYGIKDITITSKFGAKGASKLQGATLPEGAIVQGGLVQEGTDVYKMAAEKMATIADKFEVISLFVYNENGDQIKLDKPATVVLRVNPDFDITNLKVFYMYDDGSLQQLNILGGYANQYINVPTDLTGNFIVCEPGVKYVMPMKVMGPLMLLGMIAVVVIIVVPIVVAVKKKKKKAIANGTYVSKAEKKANKKLNKAKK